MPVRVDGELQTMSLVVSKEQAQRLRALAALRSTKYQKVSISDVVREVIDAGLVQVLDARGSSPAASDRNASSGNGVAA